MSGLKKNEKILSYVFQLVAAAILAQASYAKFIDGDMSILIFEALGISETRIFIAIIEAIAAVLLITRSIPQYGAILGFGTMLGAFIAHVTVLGLEVNNDGGAIVMSMVAVIISTIIIMGIRRRSLPLIGHTFS